jgi:NAD-dependent dihydropyrimidine dehydrogenase PreA subunit
VKQGISSRTFKEVVMNTIQIDGDVCSGCGICYDACFVDVFRWDEEESRPIVAYPEDCVECNKCELSCPDSAIEVIVDFDLPWPQVV